MNGKTSILILLAVCALPAQCNLLGSRKCTYGPSYWCSSLRGAKECSAVHHCIQTVWEKQQLPEDNDDICTICKNMVQQARDQLLSNETQEEIREVFDGSCRLIPIKILSDECQDIANEFIPELIDTLASQMNPQVVCATAGLCNSVIVDRLLQQYERTHHENAVIPPQNQAVQDLQTPQPGDCESCKDFVKRTIRLVKTHSQAELMDRLFAVCGRLGSLSDGCMALVQTNFHDIYKLLTQELTPENFCDLVEMCETRMHEGNFYQRLALPQTGDEPCDFCEAIVQHWRNVMTANTTEMEFKEILEGLCRQTRGFSKNCLALVEEYYEPLYTLLVSAIHPKEICESVGFCGESSVFKLQSPVWTILHIQEPEVVAQVPLLPAILVQHEPGSKMTGQDEAVAISFDHQENDRPNLINVPIINSGIAVSNVGTNGVVAPAVGKTDVKDDNKCVMCEFVMQFLQNMLEQKDTREDIENAVERVCLLLPHTLSEECQDYVEAYGDQVIELLAQEIDPAKVCQMMHLCPTEPGAVAVNEDVSCVMCEYALTELDQLLGDRKTEEDIRQALDKLCSLLPKTVRNECQNFVDTYTEQVIHMLIDQLTPDQICTELGLCKAKVHQLQDLAANNQLPLSRMFIGVPSSASSNSIRDSTDKKVDTSACVLCEFILTEINHCIKQNTTKGEIVKIVGYIRAHLPDTIMNECISFMGMYGDSIIDMLANQELDPKVVCQTLKLCTAARYTGLRATLHMDKCQICEAIVTQLDNELEKEDVEKLINSLIEKVCKYLPHNVDNQCRDIVEVYGPYLANLLAEVLEPKKVCEELNLCQMKPGQQSLLGGNKCSWGPSYWCQTKIHADACNAGTHCEQTVWRMNLPLI